MHRTSLLILAPILLLLPTTFTNADETAADASLQEYFVQLNATMQQVVTLLQRQIEGDETNLLIKRIELSARSLSAKKDRLKNCARKPPISKRKRSRSLAR